MCLSSAYTSNANNNYFINCWIYMTVLFITLWFNFIHVYMASFKMRLLHFNLIWQLPQVLIFTPSSHFPTAKQGKKDQQRSLELSHKLIQVLHDKVQSALSYAVVTKGLHISPMGLAVCICTHTQPEFTADHDTFSPIHVKEILKGIRIPKRIQP